MNLELPAGSVLMLGLFLGLLVYIAIMITHIYNKLK
jgi:hypothetical protein